VYEVEITPDAGRQFTKLPVAIQRRAEDVFGRLRQWPDVSGAKPLRHSLKGSYRVRTGDWRILFTADESRETVVVYRIAHRREVYE
jgi:mRNA interferase RelE/StbE